MSKTYLTVASHWHVPGVRQYASTERVHAEAKAVELVEELRTDWAEFVKDEDPHGMLVPPPVSGRDWETTLRALQLDRLIQYSGGEGEANDALFHFCHVTGQDEPPLIGEGFVPRLQLLIADYVAEDDTEEADAKIGFPMVWIEEVESAVLDGGEFDPDAVSRMADMALVLELAERFVNEGEIADRDDDSRGNAQHAIARLRSTCAPMLTDRAPIAFALRNASGAISSLLHQVGQMSGMFDDADGTIQDAVDAGEEAETELDNAIATLEAAPPAGPITVAVSVSGGVLQWGGADRGGVQLIVVDYDQDGAEPHRVVDMAEPGDRPEMASVGFETVEVNAEAIQKIKDKLDEQELREKRFDDNDCILCGTDLDAPSADGAEEGICPGCMGPHGGNKEGKTDE